MAIDAELTERIKQLLAQVTAGNEIAAGLVQRADPAMHNDETLTLLSLALQYTAQNTVGKPDELAALALSIGGMITAAYQYGHEHTLNLIAGGQCEHCRRVAAGDLTIGRAVRTDFLWSHKAADGFHTCYAADVWNAVDRDIKDTPIG